MIRACSEITRGNRRVGADEDRSGIAHLRRGSFGRAEQYEVLRRDRLRCFQCRDDLADGLVTVLGLRRDLELGDARVAALAEHDDDLGRPAGKVDRNVAPHFELRIVHVRPAWPDDLVDALDVREEPDRLRATDRPHLAEPEQLRRAGDETGSVGRRTDHKLAHARRDCRHGTHDEG